MVFFSRENLPRIKNLAYVITLDDKISKGTYWVSLFIDKNTSVYFDSFGIEYISREALTKIKDKSITHNIFRIQSDANLSEHAETYSSNTENIFYLLFT